MAKKEKSEKKEESLFQKFKTIWVVPRYKALIKLGLYAIFFASLFLIAQLTSNKPSNISNNPKSDIKFNSYTYVFKINKYLNNELEVIKYTGTSTNDSNTGLITHSTDTLSSSYIVNKLDNKIYIDGIEADYLYEYIDDKYFSYEYLDCIIKSSSNNLYKDEYGNNITITKQESSSKKVYKVDFNDNVEPNLYDKITLELEYVNLK